jgi:splicing factor 3B subunit 3
VSVIPLDGNEAAFSLAIVPFSARAGQLYLVVGTAKDAILSPRSCASGFLQTYKFTDDGQLEFEHKVCLSSIYLLLAFDAFDRLRLMTFH